VSIPHRVFDETLKAFFSPIVPFLECDDVSEIMINGHQKIYIEENGKVRLTDRRFDSEHALMSALRNLSQFVGRELNTHKPILEARFPDGSRVEAIIPPASAVGPVVSIRRFSSAQLTVERLIDLGALSESAADLLRVLVASQQNIIVAGGAGSGKTSVLNVLASFVGKSERVVVIEDSMELRLPLPHVVQLESQPPDVNGRGAVTIRDLFRATLRMRPDRIVIGEIRGGESLDLIQAMTSGHRGCLSTVHATYPIDTLNRLETMALMSNVDIPQQALRAQIASAVDIIVQTSRLPNGSRCVTHITEVVGYGSDTGYQLGDLFVRNCEQPEVNG
jgi:pilus assembly protein CpaF